MSNRLTSMTDSKERLLLDKELKKLVKRCQEGDEDAFSLVYDALAEPVYKFIYMRVSHRETAEDLLSVTFLKTWKNINKYHEKNNAKFSTWLFQISYNVIRDYWRSQKIEVPIEEYIEKEVMEKSKLDDDLDKTLQREHMRAALQRLSENYQNVITLRFISQLSVEETAAVMGKTNGTVRVMQVRAIRALKKIIND